MAKRKLSRNEEYELNMQRFVNHHKHQTIAEMNMSVLEIKSSSFSEFEYRLQDALRGNFHQMTLGHLVSVGIVIERLMGNNTVAREELKEIYSKIRDAQEKI